jgi:hypothetical protein
MLGKIIGISATAGTRSAALTAGKLDRQRRRLRLRLRWGHEPVA